MGGHAIPNTSPIKKDDFNAIIEQLSTYLPNGLQIFPFGSAGKKIISNDLDLFIDNHQLEKIFDCDNPKKHLQQYFINQGLTSSRSGIAVHVGIPFDNTTIQVDLIAVDYPMIIQQLHDHTYDDDTVSGKTIISMWCDLARMSSPSLLFSPYTGLFIRDTREFITADKNTIAKFIIGQHASGDDLRSPSRILKAVKNQDAISELTNKYNL
jgi:hypothetical protein